MNKVAYIVYRNPVLYKIAEDKKDSGKPDSDKKDTPSGPSDKKVYTQSEFDAMLANYTAGRTGGKPVNPTEIYEDELRKRKTRMNVLDSRVHNAAIRAKGVNPKLVFGGALLGYGAGALASKLMGFDADGSWYDSPHRSQLFGFSGKPTADVYGADDKFIKSMGRHYGTMNNSAIDSIYSTAKEHGYPQKIEETKDSMGNFAFKVTYGDGSTGMITEGVDGTQQNVTPRGKNPMRWAGYGLRGLGFLLGGAVPYLTSRVALELPYDAAAYANNRFIRK